MAEKTLKTRIINKHDTEANWNKATSFVPKAGEVIIYEADSTHSYPRIKVGDGATAVTALPFSTDGLVTLSTEQTISGKKTFTGGVQFGANTVFNNNEIIIPAVNTFKVMGMYDVSLPSKSGTLATTGDIPSTSSFATLSGNNTFTGITSFTNTVSLKSVITTSGFTAQNESGPTNLSSLRYDSIIRTTNNASYTLTIPAKNGTLALTSDITDTKNTAGATDTSSLLYLIGATTQTANPQTYSHDTLYIDGSGRLHNVAANTSVSVQNTIRLDPVNQHVLVGTGGLGSEPANYAQYGTSSIICKLPTGNAYSYYFPAKTGTLALTSDIPSSGGSVYKHEIVVDYLMFTLYSSDSTAYTDVS